MALPFSGNGMMAVLLLTLLVYGLGLLLTAVGSRLAGRCTTWCCALCGLPMWVVGGTVAPFCLALPQLMLAFLAAGLSITGLAVGTALAGAVASLGLALAVCLLNPRHTVTVDRSEFFRKCLLLLAACGVLALFVRDGTLSYTGTGLLMFLFVVFVLISIVYQHHYIYGERSIIVTTDRAPAFPQPESTTAIYGYTAHTMAFPVMSVANALKNLAGVLGGLVLLAGGAQALVYSVASFASLTGTIQALWAATLISFGFCLPLLADALDHPFGLGLEALFGALPLFSAPHPAHPADQQRHIEPDAGPAHLSLMYRERLPFGSQFRHYDLPACAAMTLVLLLPPLLRRRLYRCRAPSAWGCICSMWRSPGSLPLSGA